MNELPHDTVSPYKEVLNCVASQLTDQQRGMGWTVGDIPDRTGQINMVADAGTGTFSTQAANDLMLTSLSKTGVTVVDSGQVFQQRVDWYLPKEAAGLVGDGNTYRSHNPATGAVTTTSSIPVMPGTIMPPRYLVQGAISSLDFVPGGGITANVAIIQGQHLKNALRIGIDMHVTHFPVGPEMGGQAVVGTPLSAIGAGSGSGTEPTRYSQASSVPLSTTRSALAVTSVKLCRLVKRPCSTVLRPFWS